MNPKSKKTLALELFKKIEKDSIPAYAAQAAFFIIIACFPFFMLLLNLLKYLPITEQLLAHLSLNIIPDTISAFLVSMIQELYRKSSGAFISVTVITTVWSSSHGIMALFRGFNSVYDIDETRNYFYVRGLAILYTLAFVVMLVIALVLLVFGDNFYFWLQQALPYFKEVSWLISWIKPLLSFCVFVMFFIMLFVFIPNRKTTFLSELPGAFVSAVGWMGFSMIYSFYIDNMSNYTYIYGSITAVVLLMLWLYFCMYIMLLGAELNMFIKVMLENIKLKKSLQKEEK